MKSIRKIVALFFILTTLFITACEDEPIKCPNCNGDDDENQKSAMVAILSGAYKLDFDSESFEYHKFNFNEYIMREIIAKMYVDTAYMEIRMTFNDYSNNRKNYDFSGNDAKATVTYYSMPAEYFQYNVKGTLNIASYNDDEIHATFSMEATTSNVERKVTITQGTINFTKKK